MLPLSRIAYSMSGVVNDGGELCARTVSEESGWWATSDMHTPCLRLYAAAISGNVLAVAWPPGYLLDVKEPTQKWNGTGQSNCLIKTMHCHVW
nr:hypothetical protein HmN_001021000 [Hymenolepis microstoma]